MEEEIDDIVGYWLPRLNQGSLGHTRRVLRATVALFGEIAVTEQAIADGIRRCGYIPARVAGRRMYLRPSAPQAPVA